MDSSALRGARQKQDAGSQTKVEVGGRGVQYMALFAPDTDERRDERHRVIALTPDLQHDDSSCATTLTLAERLTRFVRAVTGDGGLRKADWKRPEADGN